MKFDGTNAVKQMQYGERIVSNTQTKPMHNPNDTPPKIQQRRRKRKRGSNDNPIFSRNFTHPSKKQQVSKCPPNFPEKPKTQTLKGIFGSSNNKDKKRKCKI